MSKPLVGVSSCLLGESVRYDGNHSLYEGLTAILQPIAKIVSICPEMAIGLGVPRAPIQLVYTRGGVRALGIENPDNDVTDDLAQYAQKITTQYPSLVAYIFKSKSPSCGIRDVKCHQLDGSIKRSGTGIFMSALQMAMPQLLLIDDVAFSDLKTRSEFINHIVGG